MSTLPATQPKEPRTMTTITDPYAAPADVARYADVPNGCIPVGSPTELGRIVGVSNTAYKVRSDWPGEPDEWVAFRRIHGARPPATPLVVFA